MILQFLSNRRSVLKNNITARNLRQKDRAKETIGRDEWGNLDDLEKEILTYMSGKVNVTRSELCEITKNQMVLFQKDLIIY